MISAGKDAHLGEVFGVRNRINQKPNYPKEDTKMASQGIMNPRVARQRYNVNKPGSTEGLRQSLYHFQTYAAAGQTSLRFFQSAIGAGGITRGDTNMLQSGSLPNPQSFLLNSIQLYFFPGVNPSNDAAASQNEFTNDVWQVYSGLSWLELTIGSKTYQSEAPLMKFPPQNRLSVAAAIADTTTAAGNRVTSTNYAAASGPVYKVQGEMWIPPTQNFDVTIYWPTAVALPSTVAGRIGVVLDGVLYRSVQ